MSRAQFFFLFACSCATTTTRADDAGPPDGGPWACPTDPPAVGSPCPPPLSCEYEDPSACGKYFQCSGTNQFDYKWQALSTTCSKLPACAATFEAGVTCANNPSATCELDGGYCGCANCYDDGGQLTARKLECLPYTSPPGCPPSRPRMGTPCDGEGVTCDYRRCFTGIPGGNGPAVRCLAGLWVLASANCTATAVQCP